MPGSGHLPDWVPPADRARIDTGALAPASEAVDCVLDELGRALGCHMAAYAAGGRARPRGLCAFYEAAALNPAALARLMDCERRLGQVVLVAYAKPLRRYRS